MKVSRQDLIGDKMLRQNEMLHASPKGFGGSGWKQAETVLEYARELGAKTILDYGCGEQTLSREMRKIAPHKFHVREYDPAIHRLSAMPKVADLVVCTDVLEHVEPEKLALVLQHLWALTARGCYLVIATRPANKILPNGANAHLIIEDPEWWGKRICALPWRIARSEAKRKGDGSNHDVRFWLKR